MVTGGGAGEGVVAALLVVPSSVLWAAAFSAAASARTRACLRSAHACSARTLKMAAISASDTGTSAPAGSTGVASAPTPVPTTQAAHWTSEAPR